MKFAVLGYLQRGELYTEVKQEPEEDSFDADVDFLPLFDNNLGGASPDNYGSLGCSGMNGFDGQYMEIVDTEAEFQRLHNKQFYSEAIIRKDKVFCTCGRPALRSFARVKCRE